MLYNVLKSLINLGKTEGLSVKLDVFYATEKITQEEYLELTGLLPKSSEV